MASFASLDNWGGKPTTYNSQGGIYFELHPKEIRLVKLLRGRRSDEIYCQLEHAQLANRPSYKSLSYAWGSPKATRPIIVNGCQHFVTVNLESALLRLRQIDSELVIWIDALSINQLDYQERNAQVKLMHDIFSLTEEVIVYLGEVPRHDFMASNKSVATSTTTFYGDDRDQDNLEAFKKRCIAQKPVKGSKGRHQVDYAFDIFGFLRLLSGAREGESNDLPAFDTSGQFIDTVYQRNLFEGLRQLMLARWWNRIWVIQEVVVPKKITMVYGSAMAPWDTFAAAARWDLRNRSSSAYSSFPQEYSSVVGYFSRIILDIDRMRALWRDGDHTSLLTLLRRFSGRKASDDRDKVYALLSLARDGEQITPNYSLNVPDVFQSSVLDIISTTQSLAVLVGDLGRKNRRDLPSWVPDWSAAYDDTDRRRAERTVNYKATGDSIIYLQHEGAQELTGIRHYIRDLTFEEIYEEPDYVERFHTLLGTKDWINWLPDHSTDSQPSADACLVAIDAYWTTNVRAGCLRHYGNGIIDLAGYHIDSVAVTAETALSEEELLPVIRSWAMLACTDPHIKSCDRYVSLGEAFRTIVCAGVVPSGSDTEQFGTRSIDEDDHKGIAAWLFQNDDQERKENSKNPVASLGELFRDLGDLDLIRQQTEPTRDHVVIDSAIKAATTRRTFFITERGHIGLGPAKLRIGDKVSLFLGGQTPFIVRYAGDRKIPRVPGNEPMGYFERQCFEVIGDAYVQGLMDGEAIDEWRNVVGGMKKENLSREYSAQSLLSRWRRVSGRWERLMVERSQWESTTSPRTLIRQLEYDSYCQPLLRTHSEDSLQSVVEWAMEQNGDFKGEERASSYTSDISKWWDEFKLEGDISWKIHLVKAAKRKLAQINKSIADAKTDTTEAKKLIKREQQVDEIGQIFLV